MSDLETEKFRQIGIGLINEYRQQRGFGPISWLAINTPEVSAFIRSIQLHEKTKEELQGVKQELADFKQKVSDAVQSWVDGGIDRSAYLWFRQNLEQFITPAPKRQPVTEVWRELFANSYNLYEFIDALEARGLEIREKNDD